MELDWKDLPERKNCFTVRNAATRDLKTNKIVQYYSANTRITVVQKCITGGNTYYRTRSAVEQGLDWAFEASAFGLPNEAAPLEPSVKPSPSDKTALKLSRGPRKTTPIKKQKAIQKAAPSKSGERVRFWDKMKIFFGRKNG